MVLVLSFREGIVYEWRMFLDEINIWIGSFIGRMIWLLIFSSCSLLGFRLFVGIIYELKYRFL